MRKSTYITIAQHLFDQITSEENKDQAKIKLYFGTMPMDILFWILKKIQVIVL